MLNKTSKSNTSIIVRRLVVCVLGLVLVTGISAVWAQEDEVQTPAEPAAQSASSQEAETAAQQPQPGEPAAVKDPLDYDLWVLAPAVVAILLTILMRQAVPALFIGVVVGAYMMVPCRDAAAVPGDNMFLGGIRLAVETYVIQNLYTLDGVADPKKIQIVLFTLLIGGAVGVMAASGGSRALVDRVARYASTSRRGQLTGWLAGMVVFFDDYANSMLVGPTMRPMFDRLKISRAKLAYIVDSTAAPVASIALIGTWIGAELSYIDNGLQSVAAHGTPGFMADMDSMSIFIATIPYRFYPILALWMVFVVAFTGLDFGPMRRSESRALMDPPVGPKENPSAGDAGASTAASGSAWLAVIPILVLVGATVAILYLSGVAALGPVTERTLGNILKGADAYLSILYGAISSLSIAMLLVFFTRACSIRVAFDGALDGMAKMFPAIVILVLAWALSQISQDLQLGQVLKEHLLDADIAPAWLPTRVWLPLSIFICAAGVSFATGTSWTTMGILTPVVVEISAEMAGGPPVDLELFYTSVGSVLAGSIFGDHCSPISDTTVLSSVASNCRVEEHVWTQMPYAIVAAIVAMGAGIVYCMHENQPAWMGLAIGAGAILLIVLLIGRRPKAPPTPQHIPVERVEARLNADGQ
ncbi:MAG: Na+/H+ antiporter NhaC family protein [Phycisphaerae bacterium]